jgi:hypothetical protein
MDECTWPLEDVTQLWTFLLESHMARRGENEQEQILYCAASDLRHLMTQVRCLTRVRCPAKIVSKCLSRFALSMHLGIEELT